MFNSLLWKLSRRLQVMVYGVLSLMVKQRPMQLTQLHLFSNTKTCNYFIDCRKIALLQSYLGIKSHRCLTWPDYLSRCIAQKLQVCYTVSYCLRYIFFYQQGWIGKTSPSVCVCAKYHLRKKYQVKVIFMDDLNTPFVSQRQVQLFSHRLRKYS